MSISKDIAPLLPNLRRFSRALNGSQRSGDAYLTATLECLLENLELFDRDLPARLALYKLYIDVWSATHIPGDAGGEASSFERNLASLSPRTRQAFLLKTVEDFSLEEIATVMGISTSRANVLLGRGAQDIAQELATRVLIIEDEPLIAMDLESIVEDLGHQVVGVARVKRQAIALAAEHKPELILADIQLADGSSGIEAVNEIVSVTRKPVIFITGHPGIYLGSGSRRPEPAFLLQKPFSPEAVRSAVSQALFFDRKAHAAA